MNRTYLHVLYCLAWLGCGSREPVLENPEVSNKPSSAVLAAKADQALANSLRLDYRRPMLGPRPDRAPIAELYLAACRAGDERSCWVAAEIHDSAGIATAKVRENCRAGHLMSCRALPQDMMAPVRTELAGWAGRSRTCGDPDGCPRSALQQECAAGFPWSCEEIILGDEVPVDLRPPNYQLSHELLAPLLRLARQGCHADVLRECLLLASRSPRIATGSSDDELLALERVCAIAIDCWPLAVLYQERGLRAKAQEALERDCQFGTGGHCSRTADGYLDDHWPEPIPHRGEDLATWACQHEGICRSGSVPRGGPTPP